MFDYYKITTILTALNIPFNKKLINGKWLGIKCPNPAHNDKNFGNCNIDINTGVYNCFSCNTSENIISVIQKRTALSFKEIVEEYQLELISNSLYQRKSQIEQNKKVVKEKKLRIKELPLRSFNPFYYEYTKSRGYTKTYNEKFKIKEVCGGYYKDYYYIPITEKEGEFRKLKEYETLINFFEADKSFSLKNLKNSYEKYVSENHLKYTAISEYINKPKTLYYKNSQIKNTLYNIDNLNFKEDLILFEGLGSHPKVYQSINENCTCTFGVQFSQKQLELLKNFKKNIIIIPDMTIKEGSKTINYASNNFIWELNENLPKVFIFNVLTDDKLDSFVNDIKTAEMVPAVKGLLRLNEIT